MLPISVHIFIVSSNKKKFTIQALFSKRVRISSKQVWKRVELEERSQRLESKGAIKFWGISCKSNCLEEPRRIKCILAVQVVIFTKKFHGSMPLDPLDLCISDL